METYKRYKTTQTQRLLFYDKLDSASFRLMNEKLYTCTGKEAQKYFTENISVFNLYHRGFASQVKKWPINPVKIIIEWLETKPNNQIVGDFGCGDAQIARSVDQEVYSYDLVAKNNHVTACNIANVPLKSGSLHIVIFCLADGYEFNRLSQRSKSCPKAVRDT